MENNTIIKLKKIFFYILIALIAVWLILSVISIFSFLDPRQSAPWYTGIIVVSMFSFFPIIIIFSIYLYFSIKIKRGLTYE